MPEELHGDLGGNVMSQYFELFGRTKPRSQADTSVEVVRVEGLGLGRSTGSSPPEARMERFLSPGVKCPHTSSSFWHAFKSQESSAGRVRFGSGSVRRSNPFEPEHDSAFSGRKKLSERTFVEYCGVLGPPVSYQDGLEARPWVVLNPETSPKSLYKRPLRFRVRFRFSFFLRDVNAEPEPRVRFNHWPNVEPERGVQSGSVQQANFSELHRQLGGTWLPGVGAVCNACRPLLVATWGSTGRQAEEPIATSCDHFPLTASYEHLYQSLDVPSA
ncbi:hypothetical protein B0H16DRAFT_1464334 [Mycena metata]|uniref:Uncharacterized protein n=1 Tax=Mycena metata TaxID=1033252 RepID=A0AAD7N168_9AGAR|nr:hypothetical protein B0H16DRAFT_1464334 [Mycena metata]